MNPPYSREWLLPASDEALVDLLAGVETLLRLGPQWNVKSVGLSGPPAPAQDFSLEVEHDRTETLVCFSGKVLAYVPGKTLRLVIAARTQTIDFSAEVTGQQENRLISFRIDTTPSATVEDLREYDLWARSIVNYLEISGSRSPLTRIWKWFIDRYWLKMTQSGKRIVFFIVVTEGFSLLFLISLLAWWKWVSAP
jgi:hypothetical protein